MQWFHFSLAQKIDVSWVSSYYKISLMLSRYLNPAGEIHKNTLSPGEVTNGGLTFCKNLLRAAETIIYLFPPAEVKLLKSFNVTLPTLTTVSRDTTCKQSIH